MELGLFQLENLLMNPNMFMFLDLRGSRDSAHPAVDGLLKRAHGVSEPAVDKFLDEKRWPKERPVVLVCADGMTSARTARALEAAGFEQIYIVAGGVAGLLSEV